MIRPGQPAPPAAPAPDRGAAVLERAAAVPDRPDPDAAPLRVAFIAAECEPYAKVGGLGDVVDSLARALGRVPGALAEPVEVFLPRYRTVPLPAATGALVVVRVPDPRAPGGASDIAVRSFDVEGYRLRLVDHPPAFDRAGIYGDAASDYPDNAWRFALLARAALETRRAEARPLDVVALHEWHACPAVLARDLAYAGDAIIGEAAMTLTIHNLAYHGWVPREQVADLGLGADPPVGWPSGVNLLQEGIARVEMLNAVSPGYAREVLEPDHGRGLDGDLRARGDRFTGIVNGLDQALWDPATDEVLAARYDAADLAGKAVCRADLCARLELDPADAGPILATIGRLDPQKGFDLVAGAVPDLVAMGARVVALGSGHGDLVAGMRAAADAHPGRVVMVERFDRDLARRIYAGADLFLMPSRFEPCGQGQMIAMRYGTPPVARRTGGLGDTIVDAHEDPARGTGFLFDEASPAALRFAVERALAVRAEPARWVALVRRAMAVDWSWERASAPAYVAMFRRAVEARRQAARG